MELKQYMDYVQARMARLEKQFSGPKRLLVVRLGEARLQALILNHEKGVYGIEECGSRQWSEEKASLEQQLEEMLESWEVQSDKVALALWQEGLYQEEFTLPGLPIEQLKTLILEEAKLRIPLEAGTYLQNYILLKGEEEHRVRLAAINNLQLAQLKHLSRTLNLKLDWISGGLFSEVLVEEKVEFWNCFCDKEKAKQLQEEFCEIIAFGIGCLQGEGVLNLYPKIPWWKDAVVCKQAAAISGFFSLALVLLSSFYIGWELHQLENKIQVTELQLQSLTPWQEKQQLLFKLQEDIRRREHLHQQAKSQMDNNTFWLEKLGQLIPARCWLTSLEEKNNQLWLKGRALEIGSVELFRKQLQSLKACKGCELVECKEEQEGTRVAFCLKVQK